MSLSICALLTMCSCIPNDVNETVGDVQAVVDRAGVVVSILQSTGGTNRDKQEELAALMFTEAASRAAWLSVSESNSKASVSQKNEKIIAYFSQLRVPSLDQVTNPDVKAGEEQLTGSIKLLLGQLESNHLAIAANPRIGDVVPQWIPQALTIHLNKIRQRAIDNITAANLLIQHLQQ